MIIILSVFLFYKVLDSALHWINHDKDERKSYLLSLFTLVRLHFLSKSYLQDLLSNVELVKADDGAKILINSTIKVIFQLKFSIFIILIICNKVYIFT